MVKYSFYTFFIWYFFFLFNMVFKYLNFIYGIILEKKNWWSLFHYIILLSLLWAYLQNINVWWKLDSFYMHYSKRWMLWFLIIKYLILRQETIKGGLGGSSSIISQSRLTHPSQLTSQLSFHKYNNINYNFKYQ